MARQSSRRQSQDATNTLGTEDHSLQTRKRDSSTIQDNEAAQMKRPRTERSREPLRDTKRPSTARSTTSTTRSQLLEVPNNSLALDPSSLNPDDPEDLAKFLGFSSFTSTKGIKIPGNNVGVADVKRKQREYTQMLHRKKLYEIPMTRQQQAEKEAADQAKMQE